MRRHLAWTITSSDSSQQRAQTFEAGWGEAEKRDGGRRCAGGIG